MIQRFFYVCCHVFGHVALTHIADFILFSFPLTILIVPGDSG